MKKLTSAVRDYMGKRLQRYESGKFEELHCGYLRQTDLFCVYFLYKKNFNFLTCDNIESNKALTLIYTDSKNTYLDTIFCDTLSNFPIWYLFNKANLTVYDERGCCTPCRIGKRGAAFG
jgi:hypothetical protein